MRLIVQSTNCNGSWIFDKAPHVRFLNTNQYSWDKNGNDSWKGAFGLKLNRTAAAAFMRFSNYYCKIRKRVPSVVGRRRSSPSPSPQHLLAIYNTMYTYHLPLRWLLLWLMVWLLLLPCLLLLSLLVMCIRTYGTRHLSVYSELNAKIVNTRDTQF